MSQRATETLKLSTRALHEQVEATPFAKAFFNKELSMQSYAGYLRLMTAMHSCLEVMLGKSKDPLVRAVWSPKYSRLPALYEDYLWLRPQLIPDSSGLIRAILAALSHIRLVAEEAPVAILGCVYVLWGSTKGAVALKPLAEVALGVSPGKGLSYLTQHADPGKTQWLELAPAIDNALDTEATVQSAVEAAMDLFKHILDAFENLHPVNTQELEYHILSMNPDAGNHAIPQDPQAIAAVLRASDRCLAEYPYFISRYGLRGHLFSDSDGAWLATLPEAGETTMKRNIHWLRGVLSSRGIPGCLLQRHLELVHAELEKVGAIPPDHLEVLWRCAQEIEGQSEALLPRETREALSTQFLGSFTGGDWPLAREACELAFGAVVDEAEGITRAVEGLLGYYADEHLFSHHFIQAMHMLIKESRRIVAASS